MDIILDQKAKAEEILETGKIYKNICETKALIIKYYKSEGKNKDEIRVELERFLKENVKILNGGQEYNIVKDADNIEKAINLFTKDGVKLPKKESVKISKDELKKIKKIKNLPLEKLAFMLLVLCKVNNIKNGSFSEWVNDKTKDFYKYTKNREWGQNQEIMIGKLFNLGLIELPSERSADKIGMKLLYIDQFVNDDSIDIEISDFREVVLQYLKWRGEKIIYCEECGVLTVLKSNRTKYCDVCWKEKHKEIKRETWHKNKQKYKN